MEEQGYIEVRLDNVEHTLSPRDLDITDIRDLISDIELFLFPTREEKQLRPHISYDLTSGSAINRFFLPVSFVLLFNGITAEISKRNSLDFLDHKRQEIIDRFQKKAIGSGLRFELSSSLDQAPSLTIDPETNFEMSSAEEVESEFYLYGEIYQEGGKRPNIHISSSKFGNLTVAATKEQIIDGEKRTYKPYGIKVRGKRSLTDGKLTDLELIEFVNYRPVFDRRLLDTAIQRASANLGKITNLDQWIDEFRTEGI